jgi:hypothetical protein
MLVRRKDGRRRPEERPVPRSQRITGILGGDFGCWTRGPSCVTSIDVAVAGCCAVRCASQSGARGVSGCRLDSVPTRAIALGEQAVQQQPPTTRPFHLPTRTITKVPRRAGAWGITPADPPTHATTAAVGDRSAKLAPAQRGWSKSWALGCAPWWPPPPRWRRAPP